MAAGSTEGARWAWPLAVAVLLLSWFAVTRADEPPDAKGLAAADTEFSAERARAALTRVLGPSRPHPIGSEANTRVRARIVAELQRLRLSAREQAAVACRGSHCGWVHNVIAVVDGQEPGPAVLVAVHYDSVAAGPGAGDDGSGVGIVLELARALRAGPAPRHPVVLLVDDGEEAGLLGATAFVQHDAAARDVAVVVNLEARGTRGPSSMFETKGPNRWLIEALAGSVPHPAMSSLSAAVYALLPNDTDLTVFGEAGRAGVNFAFSEGVEHYHTPLDDLEHLDDRSLQHQGESALAAVRAFADADLATAPEPGELVYVDLLGTVVVRWPARWAVPLALVVLALAVAAAELGRRRQQLRLGATVLAVLAIPTGFVVAAAIGYGLPLAVGAIRGGPPPMFEPWPLPLQAGLVAVGLLVVAGLSTRWSAAELAVATGVAWAFVALLVAEGLPGGSNLFVVPAAVGLWPAWEAARGAGRDRLTIATLSFGVVALVFVGRLFFPLYAALGFVAAPGLAAIVTLVLSTCASTLAGGPPVQRSRQRMLLLGALGVLVGMGAAAAMPAGTPEHPIGLDLAWWRDRPAQRSTWRAATMRDLLPEELVEAGFEPAPSERLLGSAWPYSALQVYEGVTTTEPIPAAVEITRIDEAGFRVDVAPGIGSVEVYVPEAAGVDAVWVDDAAVPQLQPVTWTHADGTTEPHRMVRLVGPPPRFEIRLRGTTESLTLRTSAIRFGAPDTAVARGLREARPDWMVPFQFGDFEATVDAHPL